MPKGQYEIVGEQQKMGTSPVESPSANPSSGEFQKVGEEAQLSKTATTSPSANPSNGEFQTVGETVTLGRTPIKGWGSAASLPMSKRAIEQSKTK